MATRLITLTSALKFDSESNENIEIVVNPDYITHFHKAEKREGNLTHIHFVSGQTVLVKQSVEDIKALFEPSENAQLEKQESKLRNQTGYI